MSAAPQPLIAVVDDDTSVCNAIQRLVRSLQMRVDTFISGEAFWTRLTTTPYHPDCLLLDFQMPHLNGLGLQGKLAKAGHTIPIVFISAHDAPGVKDQALAAGAVAFLHKPFNESLLIIALQEALTGATAGGRQAATTPSPKQAHHPG